MSKPDSDVHGAMEVMNEQGTCTVEKESNELLKGIRFWTIEVSIRSSRGIKGCGDIVHQKYVSCKIKLDLLIKFNQV